MAPEIQILLWGVALMLTHHVPTHPPVRRALTGALGERPYQGIYSAVSFITLGGLGWTWWSHRHAGDLLWNLRNPAFVHGMELMVALGFAMLLSGSVFAAPSSITAKSVPKGEARGMSAVTRHPVLMGIAFFSGAHLLMNGWAADVFFWGTLLFVAVFGAWHEDYRKKAQSDAYASFCERTSFLPLPTPSALSRLGAKGGGAAAVGVVVAFLLRAFHTQLFS
jgi:uncharacterized membrane protein